MPKNPIYKNRKPVITIRGLKKTFGQNAVLNGFDMDLYEGETLVIMGKSGSGKSVMIKCLIGLETHDAGTINIMGRDMENVSEDELRDIRTEVGFLFQGSALYDLMSPIPNYLWIFCDLIFHSQNYRNWM